MNVVEILKAAREIISTPEKWCQHDLAIDADFGAVSVLDGAAVAFCSVGAVKRVLGDANPYYGGPSIQYDVYDALEAQMPLKFDDLDKYNDHDDTSHSDILAMFDAAVMVAK